MEEQKIVKLTGQPMSEEMQDILRRLSEKQYVTLEEINTTKEMQTARSNVDYSRPTIQLENRDELRAYIVDRLSKFGSVTIDENGKEVYNGEVEKNSRLDIVIGLPASGKSSAIVNSISSEFHSKVIDNDEAKKEIPQFNNGWGAGVVHEESQLISEAVFRQAVINHENIVLPKVGSNAQKLIEDAIDFAKSEGYMVNVHYVKLDRNKALGRMLNRFIEEGRFLDPALIDKYDNERQGNRIEQCYETLKANLELVDGYSKWDNDVMRGERPILLESQNLTGNFITNARQELSTNESNEAVKGELDYERSNDERNAKSIRIDSGDYGESGGIRTQGSVSNLQRGRKEYDNTGVGEGNGQVLQVDNDGWHVSDKGENDNERNETITTNLRDYRENERSIRSIAGVFDGEQRSDGTTDTRGMYGSYTEILHSRESEGISQENSTGNIGDVRILAERIDKFLYDVNTYSYNDTLTGTRADNVNQIYEDLMTGKQAQYIRGIESVSEYLSEPTEDNFEDIYKLQEEKDVIIQRLYVTMPERTSEIAPKYIQEENALRYDVIFKDKDGDVVTVDSIDTIDDFSEYLAPASGTFEVLEVGKLVVKGDIDDNMRDIIEEAITDSKSSVVSDIESEYIVINNIECVKVDEWQTSMGKIVLGNDISDPAEQDFYLAKMGTLNEEFFGKPTREDVEDVFIAKLGQIDLDNKEAGMNDAERKEEITSRLSEVSQVGTQAISLTSLENSEHGIHFPNGTVLDIPSTISKINEIKTLLTNDFLVQYGEENARKELEAFRITDISDEEMNALLITNNTGVLSDAIIEVRNYFYEKNVEKEIFSDTLGEIADTRVAAMGAIYEGFSADLFKEYIALELTGRTLENEEIKFLNHEYLPYHNIERAFASIVDTYEQNMGNPDYEIVAENTVFETTMGSFSLSDIEERSAYNIPDNMYVFNDDSRRVSVSAMDIIAIKTDVNRSNTELKNPAYKDNLAIVENEKDFAFRDMDELENNGFRFYEANAKIGFEIGFEPNENGRFNFYIEDSDGILLASGNTSNNTITKAEMLMNDFGLVDTRQANYIVTRLEESEIKTLLEQGLDVSKLPIEVDFMLCENGNITNTLTYFCADNTTASVVAENNSIMDNLVGNSYYDISISTRSDIPENSVEEMKDATVDVRAYEFYDVVEDKMNYLVISSDSDNNTVDIMHYDHNLDMVCDKQTIAFGNAAFGTLQSNFSLYELSQTPEFADVDEYMKKTFGCIKEYRVINSDEIIADIKEKQSKELGESLLNATEYSGRYLITLYDKEYGSIQSQQSFDDVSELNIDSFIYNVAGDNRFEIEDENDNVIIKGEVDSDMRDIIEDGLNSIDTSIEINDRQLVVPMTSEDLANRLSDILIVHDDTYMDLSIEELHCNLLNQIEECKAGNDAEKIESLMNRLDVIAERGIMTEEESKIAYECMENLDMIRNNDNSEMQINEVMLNEMKQPHENHFNSIGEIIHAQLPQTEQDIEIALLLQRQGRTEDFISTTQFLAKNQPEMAIQLADNGASINEKENPQNVVKKAPIQEKRDNPLNKVEELLEGNYNQIDGIINNVPLEKEERTSFSDGIERSKERAIIYNNQNERKQGSNTNEFDL